MGMKKGGLAMSPPFFLCSELWGSENPIPPRSHAVEPG